MDKHPIDAAAEILGSQAALASALNVTKAAVNQWKLPGRRTPAEHCPKIEQLTGGRVRCEELRPDVEWGVLREQAAPDPVLVDFQDTVPVAEVVEPAHTVDVPIREDGTVTENERVDPRLAAKVPAVLGVRSVDRIRLEREHGEA